jgi:hypothetical protein
MQVYFEKRKNNTIKTSLESSESKTKHDRNVKQRQYENKKTLKSCSLADLVLLSCVVLRGEKQRKEGRMKLMVNQETIFPLHLYSYASRKPVV